MNYTNINENIRIYFNEIRKFASLTRNDEIELFTRIANGDKCAETEIFNRMSKLAVNIAKTYTGKSDLLEDLIQEANMGILRAIGMYDLSAGYRFSSYARWWMKAFINKYLQDLGIVHHNSNILIDKANKIREKFYKENHREISEYELMDALEEMGEVVKDITPILNITHIRIDLPIDCNGDDITKCEQGVFADYSSCYNDFINIAEAESLTDDISRRLSNLDTREQRLILLKFGFIDGFEYDSNKALAEKWNMEVDAKALAEGWDEKRIKKEKLTQERVRQIVEGALKKMK